MEDEKLFEVAVPRAATKPKILISRKPVTMKAGLKLDALSQNSQGHYIILDEPKE